MDPTNKGGEEDNVREGVSRTRDSVTVVVWVIL